MTVNEDENVPVFCILLLVVTLKCEKCIQFCGCLRLRSYGIKEPSLEVLLIWIISGEIYSSTLQQFY